MKQTSSVIYARVSSSGDRQSTDRQVRDLQTYAASVGHTVVNVFTEHISGAKRNEERPVLCECLNYCVANSIDTLLLSELSRLGRNVDEVLANIRFCKDHRINIFFQKENLSIFNPDGSVNPFLTIMVSVLGTCAQLEREAIMFRLNSGRRQAIAKGVKMGKPKGATKSAEQKREEYREVISLLKRGVSIRHAAKISGHGISTIQRIKKEFL